MDLISVIVPVYNSEKYLTACVESILKQTYKHLEIILVDDGSTDNSKAICDQYAEVDSRIRVIHKNNGGPSDARNAGLRIATGSFVTFVDSDDRILPDMVEYLYQLARKHNCKLSICTHTIIWADGKRKKGTGNGSEERISCKDCLRRMLYHDVIDTSAWAKLYSADLFSDVAFPVGKLFEDIATVYKLFIKSGDIACGYANKYEYRIRGNSITTKKFSGKKLELIEMTDLMGKEVLKKFPSLKDAVLRRRVYARFSTLNQMLDVDGYEKERKEIIGFIKENSSFMLKNPLTSVRDKAAVFLMVYGGYTVYKFVWKAIRYRKFAKQ